MINYAQLLGVDKVWHMPVVTVVTMRHITHGPLIRLRRCARAQPTIAHPEDARENSLATQGYTYDRRISFALCFAG